jgi:hypothetical protein
VSVSALSAEAGVWFSAAGDLRHAADQSRTLAIEVYDTAVFQEFITEVNAAATQVAALCDGATWSLNDVGYTLNDVAKTYQAEEEANLHALTNLY